MFMANCIWGFRWPYRCYFYNNGSFTKLGTAADQEYIDFSSSDQVNTKVNDTTRLCVKNTGVDITGAAAVSGSFGCNNVTPPVQASKIDDLVGDIMGSGPSTATADTINSILAILESYGFMASI